MQWVIQGFSWVVSIPDTGRNNLALSCSIMHSWIKTCTTWKCFCIVTQSVIMKWQVSVFFSSHETLCWTYLWYLWSVTAKQAAKNMSCPVQAECYQWLRLYVSGHVEKVIDGNCFKAILISTYMSKAESELGTNASEDGLKRKRVVGRQTTFSRLLFSLL